MVRAGKPVDDTIAQLVPHLEAGDIIIDGGNSNYDDTNRRVRELSAKGLLFSGTGVSGGEEGALNGPSIMPGGAKEAWPHIKDIFQSISAKVEDGSPCCDWVGNEGAGHYVKMVHNGHEYACCQTIAEAYDLLKNVLGLPNEELASIFAEWNRGDLDSYLIEITAAILAKKDDEGNHVVDYILDTAGQKGTGKWTGINALDMGVPVTLVTEAVFGRCLSSQKEDRVLASNILKGPAAEAFKGDKQQFINDVRDAVYASFLVSCAQCFVLMRQASTEYKWDLNYGGVALMWRGGCIIRSKYLKNIFEAFQENPNLPNLLLNNFFAEKITACTVGWRRVVVQSAVHGVPTPTISAGLAYFDGLRRASGPANIIQAQRDYFGAHTYERTDRSKGEFFHTNWTGHGGSTSSNAYVV